MSTKLYLKYQSHHSNQFGHQFGSNHLLETSFLLANSHSKDFFLIGYFRDKRSETHSQNESRTKENVPTCNQGFIVIGNKKTRYLVVIRVQCWWYLLGNIPKWAQA